MPTDNYLRHISPLLLLFTLMFLTGPFPVVMKVIKLFPILTDVLENNHIDKPPREVRS